MPATTATKKSTKKATKKAAPSKASKKKSKPASGTDAFNDRAKGKKIGLGLIHYRVLRALGRVSAKNFTYRDIEEATGYYSPLAEVMHTEENYGLVPTGLARMGQHDVGGRDKLAFQITAKGKKLLAKAR